MIVIWASPKIPELENVSIRSLVNKCSYEYQHDQLQRYLPPPTRGQIQEGGGGALLVSSFQKSSMPGVIKTIQQRSKSKLRQHLHMLYETLTFVVSVFHTLRVYILKEEPPMLLCIHSSSIPISDPPTPSLSSLSLPPITPYSYPLPQLKQLTKHSEISRRVV